MKKALSLAVVFLMIFTAFPLAVFAENGSEFMYCIVSEQEKTCKITAYDGWNKVVTIPSEINGYQVIAIDREAFCNFDKIETVEIPDTVQYIGRYAFYYCTNLMRVTLPNSVTYIGDHAFAQCTSLESITIPASVKKIDFDAFFNCRVLARIDVDENNVNYSSKDGVLFNKTQTELICFPAGKITYGYTVPNSVTQIGYEAFLNSKVSCVSIPSSVTTIGSNGVGYLYENWSYTDFFEKKYGFTIIGTKGSTAETYANANDFRFVLLGDLNNDDAVDAVDARWILQTVSGLRVLTDKTQMQIADVNYDGEITAVDARWVLQAASGIRQL